jgi:hypothetical protein
MGDSLRGRPTDPWPYPARRTRYGYALAIKRPVHTCFDVEHAGHLHWEPSLMASGPA